MFDAMHFPRPMTALNGEMLRRIYEDFMGARTVLVNGYAYACGMSPRPPSREILARGAFDVWTNDYLPRIQQFCAKVRSTEYDTMSLDQLSREISNVVAEATE